MQSFLDFLAAHPELYPVVLWPLLTAILSFAQDAIVRYLPRAWAVMQHLGVDLFGILRRVWPALQKRDPRVPPLPPMGPLAVFAIVALVAPTAGCSSLTPAQTATLATEVPKIAGAGCQVAQSFTDSGLVKFLCRIVEGGGLANMSTGPAGLDARPQPAVEIEVLVPKDQADAFAKAHPQR